MFGVVLCQRTEVLSYSFGDSPRHVLATFTDEDIAHEWASEIPPVEGYVLRVISL